MYALCGELYNVPLRVFTMKLEDYVVLLISTYETNGWVGKEKNQTIGGERITFKYPYTVHNHYQHIDTVNSHKKGANHQFNKSRNGTQRAEKIVFLPFFFGSV